MLYIPTATRAELESAAEEHGILSRDAAAALSTEDLRATIEAWIEEGDETGTITIVKVTC